MCNAHIRRINIVYAHADQSYPEMLQFNLCYMIEAWSNAIHLNTPTL